MNKEYLQTTKTAILNLCNNVDAKVVIFGSVARGEDSIGSDLDVGILPRNDLAAGFLSDLKEKLIDLNVPFKIDVVNLKESSEDFRTQVLSEAIVWKD